MHVSLSRNFLIIAVITAVQILVCSCRLHANNSTDSVYLKYGLQANGENHWLPNHFYYLAKQTNDAVLPAGIAKVKTLAGNWSIFYLADAGTFKALSLKAAMVAAANNTWKQSEKITRMLATGIQYPLVIRVTVLSDTMSLRLPESVTILRRFSEYRAIDVMVKSRAGFTELLDNPAVIAIEPGSRKPATELAVKRFDKATNYITKTQQELPGNNGAGTTVSIKENLFDTADIDFLKKYFLVAESAAFIDNHASTMATMVAGTGNSHASGLGVAPAARITSADFKNLMPEPGEYYRGNGIDVQNHSYGTGIENEYASDAAAYDLTTWNNSSLLHVFSAGNSGTSIPPSGTYAGLSGYANLTGSFKMSKNSLSIGGIDSFYEVQALSSKGPAYDGRIKPELVAYGIDGTSGAAAITSGAALVLQQAVSGQTRAKASAALLKALLVCGADDLGTEGPDFSSGFGSLNLYRSVTNTLKKQYNTGSLKQDETASFKITIPAGTASLSITMAYTDTPANVLSAKALVNNLDLRLQNDATGTSIYPWILSAAANPDSLAKAAIRGIDNTNNLEMVSLKNPAPGNYTISVSAKTVLSTNQPFAIAWNFEKADTLIFGMPAKRSNVDAGGQTIIRWLSGFANNVTGTVAFKLAGQNSWTNIAQNVLLAQNRLAWMTPDTTAKALIRITTGNRNFISDTFVVNRLLTLTPQVVCDDSVTISWNRLSVNGYRVYSPGDSLLEIKASTTDTIITLATSNLTSDYFAVAGVLQNMETARSFTINITQQGASCYINNLLAELDGSKVVLTASLGGLRQTSMLLIQKLINGVFITIDSLANPSSHNVFNDETLLQGGNTYRAAVRLTNGRMIYSGQQTIFYLPGRIYLLYPNPVSLNSSVYIVNRYFDDNLYANIYDITGRLIKRVSLLNAINTISTRGLQAGVYIIQYHNAQNRLGTDKLVIQ